MDAGGPTIVTRLNHYVLTFPPELTCSEEGICHRITLTIAGLVSKGLDWHEVKQGHSSWVQNLREHPKAR